MRKMSKNRGHLSPLLRRVLVAASITPVLLIAAQPMQTVRANYARSAVVKHSGPDRCTVPRLVGLDRALAVATLKEYPDFSVGAGPELTINGCWHRVALGHVTVLNRHGRGHLIVIRQSSRPGSIATSPIRVNLVLEPVPVPRGCHAPRFYQVVHRTSQLIVWLVVTGERNVWTGQYEGCVPHHGRVHVIAEEYSASDSGGGVGRWTFAGSYVAYLSRSGADTGSQSDLTVVNGRTGRVTFSIVTRLYLASSAPGEIPPLHEVEAIGTPVGRGVGELALDASGDLAWTGFVEASSGSPSEEVLYLHDHSGTREVTVEPEISGLAFVGSTLVWDSAGLAHSAPA